MYLSLIPPPTILRTISVSFMFYFHVGIQSTPTIFTLLQPMFTLPPCTAVIPWSGPVYLPVHHLFQCIDCSRGFHLGISHMYVLYFNQINPNDYLLFLYCFLPYCSTAFRAFHYITFTHTGSVFQYYSLSIITFSSPAPP
jgi:hypothetical protein